MNNELVQEYEKKLEKDEYISFDKKDLTFKRSSSGWAGVFAIVFCIILTICKCDLGLNIILSLIGAILVFTFYNQKESRDFEVIENLSISIHTHNCNVFQNFIKEKFSDYNIHNISKEIVINSGEFIYHKFLVDDENKIISLVNFMLYPSGVKNYTISQAKYSEIISYKVLDKSTTTQTSQSKTNSNYGKAIGGALVSQLLIGDAAAGAIIGNSGTKTTETTSKTRINEEYKIEIYLNRLDDSVIRIDTNSRTVVSEISSALEYILHTRI